MKKRLKDGREGRKNVTEKGKINGGSMTEETVNKWKEIERKQQKRKKIKRKKR